MLKPGEWVKRNTDSGTKWIFKYKRDFFERLDMDSRITYNQNTGVGELWFNGKSGEPINLAQSQKEICMKLREAFKTRKYICCVDGNKKTNGKEVYGFTVKFYFNVPDIPSCADQVPSIIEDNIVVEERF